jgi:hypothetical protein
VVVVGKPEPAARHDLGGRDDPGDRRIRLRRRLRRLHPRHHERRDTEDLGLFEHPLGLVVEALDRDVRGARDEARGVERGAHLGRGASVQAGELDLARARLRKRRQGPVELLLQGMAERVELDRELHQGAGYIRTASLDLR